MPLIELGGAMATSEFELDVLIKELVTDFPPASTDPVTFLGAQFDRILAHMSRESFLCET